MYYHLYYSPCVCGEGGTLGPHALSTAICSDYLPLMEYLLAQNPSLQITEAALRRAVMHGRLKTLQYIASKACFFPEQRVPYYGKL